MNDQHGSIGVLLQILLQGSFKVSAKDSKKGSKSISVPYAG